MKARRLLLTLLLATAACPGGGGKTTPMETPTTELDIAAAEERYRGWTDRGEMRDGRRVTIMADRTELAVGETVTVWHIDEVTEAGPSLYVMGPKSVVEEYVDDQLRSAPLPAGTDPFEPLDYDGRVLPGPGVDANYELTAYRLDTPGTHTIQWRPGGWASNVLTVTVTE